MVIWSLLRKNEANAAIESALDFLLKLEKNSVIKLTLIESFETVVKFFKNGKQMESAI